MATTITAGVGTTAAPDLLTVASYKASRAGRTIVHDVLGSATPDVTVRPAGPPTGTMTLVYASEAEARACQALLCTADVFTLHDTVRPQAGMRFVVNGAVGLELDESTQRVWTVTVDFMQVTP